MRTVATTFVFLLTIALFSCEKAALDNDETPPEIKVLNHTSGILAPDAEIEVEYEVKDNLELGYVTTTILYRGDPSLYSPHFPYAPEVIDYGMNTPQILDLSGKKQRITWNSNVAKESHWAIGVHGDYDELRAGPYTIGIIAKDAAGNASEPVFIEGIQVEAAPKTLVEITSPQAQDVIQAGQTLRVLGEFNLANNVPRNFLIDGINATLFGYRTSEDRIKGKGRVLGYASARTSNPYSTEPLRGQRSIVLSDRNVWASNIRTLELDVPNIDNLQHVSLFLTCYAIDEDDYMFVSATQVIEIPLTK